MNYTELSLYEVSKLLKERKVTSVELTKQCLENIKKNSHLNAVLSVREEEALLDAEKADKILDEGNGTYLTGVPILIKDNINMLGTITTCASRFLENYESVYDACVVEKLKSENAVIIGKTNMDEFAMGSSNENSAFGTCLNPIDNTRVPGGSSGGSACSVKANLCFASLGSDTGGSIRQPASFCGVVGMKPTYGLVSRYGLIAYASSLDQIGPLTKTVKDSMIMLTSIMGHDDREFTSEKIEKIDYLNNLNSSVLGVKIGVPTNFFAMGMDKNVKKAIDSAIEFFKANGAEIVEIKLDKIDKSIPTYYTLACAEASSNLGRFDGIRYGKRAEKFTDLVDLYYKSRTEGFGKEVKRRIMLGNFVLSSGYYDAYYKKAKKVQQIIKNEFNKAFSKVDVILTPTSPFTAFKIGEKVNDHIKMYLSDIFTVPVNIASLPAINIPCGKDENKMPIGMQLIGNKFSEQTLFNVADFFETNKGGEN
ncbi:MAG: Asp-tRNA(Asn)/Glu-tRNA(Gln) amidotransferase subunit GatA [Clostridiales bacterium]|nr:Asp-tRNA(Asn)/Glu-tRNA(Gln) amidotransferase subunit GatA [Clostridiales bacterium]